MSTFLTRVTEASHGVTLPFPPVVFGIVALAVMLLLLLAAWMFRRTAQTMIVGGHGHDHAGVSGAHRVGTQTGTGHGQGTQRPTAQERRH